ASRNVPAFVSFDQLFVHSIAPLDGILIRDDTRKRNYSSILAPFRASLLRFCLPGKLLCFHCRQNSNTSRLLQTQTENGTDEDSRVSSKGDSVSLRRHHSPRRSRFHQGRSARGRAPSAIARQRHRR